ncbi:MAG TPA: peptide deformylase [Pseudonocardiaceae bacterium]
MSGTERHLSLNGASASSTSAASSGARPSSTSSIQDITGDRRITIFERGVARLVAHEIDHLHGILCRDHLRPGVQPIPVEQYRGTGTGWQYHDPGTIR